MTCIARLLALKKYLKTVKPNLLLFISKNTKIKKFCSSNQCPLIPKSVKSRAVKLRVDCSSDNFWWSQILTTFLLQTWTGSCSAIAVLQQLAIHWNYAKFFRRENWTRDTLSHSRKISSASPWSVPTHSH